MPSRLIREGILSSDRIEQLDASAEVFYRRLMSRVDDHGLYDARLSVLRASLYPLRVDRVREADISRWIAACEKAGLIALYTHESKPYLQMLDTRWAARSEPKYPLPTPENSCKQENTPVLLDEVVDVVDKEPIGSSPQQGLKDCPHVEILKLWGRNFPHLSQPRVWEGNRRNLLKARWIQASRKSEYSPHGYETVEAGLRWWDDFFGYIARETKLANGFESPNRSWKPDLPWVCKAENFAKIVEGKYDL